MVKKLMFISAVALIVVASVSQTNGDTFVYVFALIFAVGAFDLAVKLAVHEHNSEKEEE